MKTLDFKNKWVLITGASSGLGLAMAKQLAYDHGANVLISARREDKLRALKTELEAHAGVQVKVLIADLSLTEDVDALIKESIEGQELYAAILNAGVTYFGSHILLSNDDFDHLLQTNVKSVVRLTSELVKHFESKGNEGGIMLVSSMAAIYPAPYQAAYSGSKAFIMSFANALALELRNPNLSLTVFAPGGIATEMTAGESFNDLKKWLMPVEEAAKEGVHALKNRKLTYIPGVLNRLGNRCMKVLPRKLILEQLAKKYLKSLTRK